MESIHLHLRVLDKAPVSRHRLPLFCLLSKAGSQTGLFPVNATLLCLFFVLWMLHRSSGRFFLFILQKSSEWKCLWKLLIKCQLIYNINFWSVWYFIFTEGVRHELNHHRWLLSCWTQLLNNLASSAVFVTFSGPYIFTCIWVCFFPFSSGPLLPVLHVTVPEALNCWDYDTRIALWKW